MRILILALFVVFLISCNNENSVNADLTQDLEIENLSLCLDEANKLAKLPLKCMQNEFPNKLNQTLYDSSEMSLPNKLHPAFYGCFDWHSSVHGHWMLVKLLKTFPELDDKELIKEKLVENISADNILTELEYFKREGEKSFERTYGWAWLLKLAEELYLWDDSLGKTIYSNLQPLTNFILVKYIEFLPKLVYPIRVGEHTNTAFGLTFAWDLANSTKHIELKSLIENRAKDFYLKDTNCPIGWEPSGYDFISPCLMEVDIMRRVLPKVEFIIWLNEFLPQLSDKEFSLEPGKVADRKDGKLVHLDGLNFSRAWCLYSIANEYEEYRHLKLTANLHLNYSILNIVDGEYEGEHWLASFAVYASSCSMGN
ncbi:DUF2891 domain-containing protein [Bacteroidota bacterium]